ncbi:uncharacterized protein LOC110418132 [Herrania umbratica]|uniref:Uncharacterized protein LOC110418132 n=1 Tax=Herrania umbratica TaxID=108875 RepID=A0A6J1AHX9_9ROSI|nr:uncharacterized protein LOC110418132 [Herrania umbratica]
MILTETEVSLAYRSGHASPACCVMRFLPVEHATKFRYNAFSGLHYYLIVANRSKAVPDDMAFLAKLSRFFLEAGVIADREALPGMKAVTFGDRDFLVTTQVDKEQKAATIKSFFFLVVISLFLFTFLGCMVARRNNRRLHIEDEEQQMLIGNAAEANTGSDLVVIQQNQFEIEANRAVDDIHHDQAHRRDCLSTFEAKYTLGTQLALANFLLEIPSAVLDQIASEDYVLIVMLISLTSMLVCLVELVCRGRKEKITWSCSSTGRIPWFYHPPPPSNKPFGTLAEMIGLACAIAQCIVTTINYSLYPRHHAATIKFCFWPMIFGFGMLCSKFVGKPNEDGGGTRTDQDGGDVTLNQASVDQPLTPAQLQQ